MRIIKVNVGERPFVKEIGSDLKPMQSEVGGLIEMLMLDKDMCIICNESGKIEGLPLNRIVFGENGRPVDVIAGDFFICYAPPESENFESVPDEYVDEYLDRFSI